MLIDSHCHLDKLEFKNDLALVPDALNNAKQNGVDLCLCIGVNLEDSPTVVSLADRYPEVYATVGVHPLDQKSDLDFLGVLPPLLKHPKVVAVGETGLDFFKSSDQALQITAFETQVELAAEHKLPLVIHTRAAKEETLSILKNASQKPGFSGGVLHCFTEDLDMAKRGVDLGFFVSFSGIVTFKNSVELQEVAKALPLDAILVETDSPWLAPVPHRGKPNSPQWVVHVAEKIAELRGIDFETVTAATSENFFKCFPKVKDTWKG
jgi:TatD DNase family protein